MLFLETMRHADALHRFASAAAERGKPVIAYKLGRSAAARELAVTHTGALAGDDDVADVFLAACGIARVDTLDGLLEGLPLLARVPLARGRRKQVGVVTTTAGGATMVVDPLASRGITIEPPSAATLARLAAAGIERQAGPPHRPHHSRRTLRRHEIRARHRAGRAGIRSRARRRRVFGACAAARDRAADHRQRRRRTKPLAAFLVPDAPDALAALARAGVPSFRTPEACADAIAAALSRQPPRPVVMRVGLDDADGGRMLDELAAGGLLDRLGIPRAPAIALDADIAAAPDLPFAYPVAVKVLSAEIAHKSDVGGVILDIGDGEALLAAMQKLRGNVAERMPGVPLAASWCSRCSVVSARRSSAIASTAMSGRW